ncbi:hypothetical protein F5Y10DRAFT_194208 [Nemania abortiva]|nr:hypothetical protein F5Y10DRAFT_194208 [Nemania abortiva]
MYQFAEKALNFANHLTGETCNFLFETGNQPFSGGECIIFALEANNGQKIGVRVEKNYTYAKVELEIQLLEAIKKARIAHLPSLIGYDLSSIPPMIATAWAEGQTLQWSDSAPPRHVRNNILKTVVEVTLDLLQIQESGGSALKWITGKISRTRTKRAENGTLPGVSLDDCRALQDDISRYHLPAFDDAPHVLIHGDLNPTNIIIKGEEVECVLDLGHAAVVPLQFSTYYPRFLTNEPRLLGDTYDWSQCGYSEVQRADRAFYLQCIAEMALRRDELARTYAEIMAHDDQEDRHWWMSAVNRMDMMRALKTRPKTLHGGEKCTLEEGEEGKGLAVG